MEIRVQLLMHRLKIGEGNRVIPAAPAGRRLVVPSDSASVVVSRCLTKEPLAESFGNPAWRKQPCLYLLHLNLVQVLVTKPAPMVDAGGGGVRPPTRTAVSGWSYARWNA